NLAAGYGPVFNRNAPLSDRTEGYSCPLFLFLMALLWKLPLGLEMLLRAKLVGIVCALAALVVAQRLAQRVGLPVWAQAATPLLLAVHTSFVITGIHGMETILMTLLVTLSAYWFIGEWEAERAGSEKVGLGSAFALAGCALTRPEGLLFGVMALGLRVGSKRGRLNRREVRWLAALLVPVGAFLLWRHAYYGLWLPNTYYAKQLPAELAVVSGGKYLLNTFFRDLSGHPVYIALALGWWALVGVGVVANRFQRAPGLIVPLLAGAQIVFVLKAGGDGMGGWRFMASALPLLMLLSVAGIAEIAEGLKRLGQASGPPLARAAIGALCAALLVTALWGHRDYWANPFLGFRSWASKGFTLSERALLRGWLLEMTLASGDWLNANVPPGSVIAYSEMGVTPYLCPQLRFLDVQGLTDHGVATLPGVLHNGSGVMDQYTTTNDVVGRYLMETRKPDLVMRGVRTTESEPYFDETILEGSYKLRAALPLPPPDPNPNPGARSFMLFWQRR
ncbi:MAG TPA: hypothetical protein VFB21_04070, partial [Chthonomonadaceae bacterium]|nr:hypothetical protein [Chthonomonadaceae bacterium]